MVSEMEIKNHVWDTLQAQEATAKDVEEYIQLKLDDYVEIDLSGTELYGEWKADFINFTASTFSKNHESAKNLRDFLRKNGVYVRKSRKAIAEELVNALHNPEEWPEQDRERPAWIQLRRSAPISPRQDTSYQDNQQSQNTPAWNKQDNSNIRGEQNSQVREGGNGSSNYNLVNLAKLYTDEQKYSGYNDTFDYKYGIFLDLCERTAVPREVYLKTFPTMLKGAALNYYYTSCKINPRISSLVELCENIRSYFEGPEHERNKPECWSNRHSQEERDKARDQYKAQLDRSFNHRLDQYVANIEGKDEGEEEDLMDEFEALIIDSGSSPPEPTLNHTFITELARIFNSRMLTQTPTIQRAGQRLVLSYGLKVYMRDISQAYTQPETNLARNFFIRPPKELNLPDGLLLKVLHPLYTGSAPIAAAVYISRLDPCLLFTSDDGA
jgi:hypothetical protein